MTRLISIILISNLLGLTVYAEEPEPTCDQMDDCRYAVNDPGLVSCETRAKDCDAAVNAALKVIDDQKQQISNYENESNLQKQIIQDQQSQLGEFIHNPVEVGLTAIVLTFIAVGLSGHLK